MISVAKKETILSYFGILKYETIGDLLHRLKIESGKLNIKLGVYKKLLTASIETLENIYKYTEHFEQDFDSQSKYTARFIVERVGDRYHVSAGNPILNSDIEGLKAKLDKINNMDKQGLREFYKATITNGQFSKKGGAGLGFIEMAKMSEDGLEFSFTPIPENDKFSFFKLDYSIPF